VQSKMNKIHNADCLEFMKQVPDNYFDLIIADPPYFEVKGEFDFIWKTFDDFLEWIELLAVEFKRILSNKGSLYVYGHAKKIAYKQIIFDKYFHIENHLVWEKNDCQTKKGISNFRSYAPVKEHILFYSKEINRTGLEEIKLDVNNFKQLREYFKELHEFIGLSLNKINKKLGHRKAEHCFYWNSTQWELPTEETYTQLKDEFNLIEFSKYREYEGLIEEYDGLRRQFNNSYFTDVLKFSQESNITRMYFHPTQKPPKLSKALISTSSDKNTKVFIPFIGSGVEAEQCISLGLDWCGCELDEDYCNIANKRLEAVQGSLF